MVKIWWSYAQNTFLNTVKMKSSVVIIKLSDVMMIRSSTMVMIRVSNVVMIRCSKVGVIRVYRVVMAGLSTTYHHN